MFIQLRVRLLHVFHITYLQKIIVNENLFWSAARIEICKVVTVLKQPISFAVMDVQTSTLEINSRTKTKKLTGLLLNVRYP